MATNKNQGKANEVSAETLEKAMAKLEIMSATSPVKMTKGEALKKAEKLIRQCYARGWTKNQICEALLESGLKVSPSTLQAYVKKKAGEAARRPRVKKDDQGQQKAEEKPAQPTEQKVESRKDFQTPDTASLFKKK